MAASDRVSIPFSFYYPSGTTTQLYASQSAGSYTSGTAINTLEPVVNTSVTITDRNTLAPATVYQTETGGALYNSLSTNASGGVSGWVDPGSYKIVAAALGAFAQTTINFEAVRGDGVTLIAPNAVTAAAIAPNSVDSTKLSVPVQNALLPVGSVLDFAGSAAPVGFLIANGQILSSTTYSSLFGVIGNTFNTGGEGAGNFRIPNLQQRVAIGLVNSAAVNAGSAVAGSGTSTALSLNQRGGEENHLLANNEMPVHSHGGSTGTDSPDHAHGFGGSVAVSGNNWVFTQANSGGPAGYVFLPYSDNAAGMANYQGTYGATARHAHTISNDGGGITHNNIQPYVTLNKIIKY